VMNCRNVEELLPLYAGGDLDEKRAGLLTEHVHACIECSQSAQEYAEANRLLLAFEPPQFEEATFAAMRSQVLREIERESSSSRLLQLLVRPFQPRIIWAVSTAVVLAVCFFAYYFIASRTSRPQGEPQLAGNQGLQAPPSSINPAPTGTASAPPTSATPPDKLRSPRAARRAQWVGRTPAVALRPARNFPQPEGAAPATLAATDKALRLEIQTSDQNIRIIWFSHPSNNEGSPKEFSKGT